MDACWDGYLSRRSRDECNNVSHSYTGFSSKSYLPCLPFVVAFGHEKPPSKAGYGRSKIGTRKILNKRPPTILNVGEAFVCFSDGHRGSTAAVPDRVGIKARGGEA